ncbi:hypothetical protein BIV57_10380 [Mangrovactinospora gilvigrisea]|uniref:Methyltransferase type 12 domain-containing protein n=1 Tax=Mangrovactinospora gilvigrisea TaxID=1428644 RepID=A0A1J7C7L6_9ACTN|nr:class I SAM-dependent methyltransferase [Mangrovactinospora gilvigrisea]OIV37524.1 hypothetical protein BIV57_10380 [Mangrovactinospora gilvigrisea]
MTDVDVDWAEESPHLIRALNRDAGFYRQAAARLAPGRRLALDLGCGPGGMATALAEKIVPAGGRVVGADGEPTLLDHARRRAAALGGPAARAEFAQVDLGEGTDALRAALRGPDGAAAAPDLIWSAAVVHHLPDQQGALDGLAELLAPGGLLAVSEGGLPLRQLPRDLGHGIAPGLESRLEAANNRWFDGLRDGMPGSVPMPYGWDEALRRAGLADVTTRNVLQERAAPPGSEAMADVLAVIGNLGAKLAELGLIDAQDADACRRLTDPEDAAWLGRRADVYQLTVRGIHLGTRAPAR